MGGIAVALLITALCTVSAHARIEIILMAQGRGLKPPPFERGVRLRGTPFGHMALYVESATYDDDLLIRQCREGERGGLVLTVDKQLKYRFFIAHPPHEFFYGDLKPGEEGQPQSRADIRAAFTRFEENYDHLYKREEGTSGFGQDYAILYVRRAWGLVYPTTREEERKIIEYWQEHRHDSFRRLTNNCVTTVIGSLNNAGIEHRSFFIRGLAPYNAWVYFADKFTQGNCDEKLYNGNYLRRAGTYLRCYERIPSPATLASRRPFNVYSLRNMEYLIRMSPHGNSKLPDFEPVDYRGYPAGNAPADCVPVQGACRRVLYRTVSRSEEFARLWVQTFQGLWFLATK
jgi:hypothetical protein